MTNIFIELASKTLRPISFIGFLPLAACKPPPTDADMLRDMPEAAPTFASAPLPSPETEGAQWSASSRSEARIIYGVPGDPALMALECIDDSVPQIEVSRFAPADEGAGALLAFVGNGHIGRIAVDSSEMGEDFIWKGQLEASSDAWEPLAGPRELTSTVPGAGMVTLNPGPLPGLLIKACRSGTTIEEAALAEDVEDVDEAPSPAPG